MIQAYKIFFYVLLILCLALFNMCSRSGQYDRKMREEGKAWTSQDSYRQGYESGRRGDSSSNIIEMREENNTYYLPIKVNGIPMEFIFDTGASIISISLTETLFLLKQGRIKDNDFLGETRFSDATGTISEGTLINLREVQIGSKTIHNVRASIVHNLEAPLLLGQSALNQFGTVTIDYHNNMLILD